MTDLETRYVGRFEWEQVLRRLRVTGLIGGSGKLGAKGRQTKGGVSAPLFMAIALTLATYGTLDGTEIYPGDAAVAVDVECALKTVRAVKAKLTDLGMLKHVRNPHARRGEEWRLTLPVEFPDSVEILTPAQHKIAATKIRDDARGKFGGSAGPPREQSDNTVTGGPVDHPDAEDGRQPGGSGGPAESGSGGSGGPASGGSGGPAYQTTYQATTDQAISGEDLYTASHPSRTREPEAEQPISPPAAIADRPRCPHGRSTRTKHGVPRCPDCRAETTPADTTDDETTPPPANPGPLKCPRHKLPNRAGPGEDPRCSLCRHDPAREAS